MATKIVAILTWSKYFVSHKLCPNNPEILEHTFQVRKELNDKISLWKGDITKLEVDVIVNAANPSLLGGGGVDGAIHREAGHALKDECETLNGCDVGEAKLTQGYNLPAKHVIHTVGTMTQNPKELQNCYKNSFALMTRHSLRSIAFPCISTGVYGYDAENAAHVAIFEARKFMNEHHNEIDRVIFCVHQDEDRKIYEELLQRYFPIVEAPDNAYTPEKLEQLKVEHPEQTDLYNAMLKNAHPRQITCNEVLSKV